MAPDKQMKESMPVKQKLMLGIMLIVVIAILWQVKGMFGGGGSSHSEIKPITSKAGTVQSGKTQQSQQMSAAAPNASASTMSAGQSGSASTDQAPAMTQLSIMQPAAILQNTTDQLDNQKKYIGKIDELETLKVQRQIAETNQAIAAARLATVTAEKGITDLLTSPKSQPVGAPSMPQGAYANQLIESNPNAVALTPGKTPVSNQVIAPDIEYSVISVAMRLHQWNAILGYQGQLYNVSIGDTLPPDGSKVTRITSTYVALRKDGKTRRIAVLSSI